MNDQQRSHVLEMIDRGELTAAEGLRILEAMQREAAALGAGAAPASEPVAALDVGLYECLQELGCGIDDWPDGNHRQCASAQ